jgi:hypothetical protein
MPPAGTSGAQPKRGDERDGSAGQGQRREHPPGPVVSRAHRHHPRHPLGASGARLMTALLSVLEQAGQRYGPQTMCEAGGLANATIIERI